MAERETLTMSAEEERDLLARQQSALLDLCESRFAKVTGLVRVEWIYRILLSDPADDSE